MPLAVQHLADPAHTNMQTRATHASVTWIGLAIVPRRVVVLVCLQGLSCKLILWCPSDFEASV